MAADTWSSLMVSNVLILDWGNNSSCWFMFITRLIKNYTNSGWCMITMNFMSFYLIVFFFSCVWAKSDMCFTTMSMFFIMAVSVFMWMCDCFRVMRFLLNSFFGTWWGRWLSHLFIFFLFLLYFFFAWWSLRLNNFLLLLYRLLRSGRSLSDRSKRRAIEIDFT